MLAVVGSILLYIQTYKITNNTLPKSMRQFAKDFYHENENSSPTKETFKPRDFCEIIHIGVVCAGYGSNVYFHALLKSLFLTRSNPIHFHLLVSSESDAILRLLFKSWQLAQVNVTFYTMNPWLKDVRWVPNGHYSGNYGLLKLIFDKVVPVKVTTKLLVLDTDLIINDDIYYLWKLIDNFDHKQAIGIGENQSPYYLGQLNNVQPWPALGTGFNSGVMLYDLKKLNDMNWDALWVNLTKRYMLTHGQADLGDQDIINSVIVENPSIVYKLPCFWNTQMSSHSTSSNCYSKYKPKIVHWNSPQKFAVATRDGDLFRGLANSVFEMNGNWFRKYPTICLDDNETQLRIASSDDCRRFTKPPDVFYRTLLFFLDHKFVSDDYDITYVTHLSFDRIHLLEKIAKLWTGPISFTLYLTDAELARAMQTIVDSEVLNSRTDIAYHAVFKQGEFYPINTLRNTGLKHVKTPYSFLVDVDFIPMKSLFELLKDNIRSMVDLKKKALIVPAFEATSDTYKLPRSKIELMESLDRKEIRPFQADVWAAGHAPTDFDKWRSEYEPYRVKWQPYFEPYVVVKSNVVPYDERFLGFGWNKVSHIMELEAQNYEFIVLSDVFIVHEPHMRSCDNDNFKRSPIYRKCIQSLKRKFVQGLRKRYNKNFTEINYSENWRRTKREATPDTTTSLYDSTDYFLTWGGKEKVEGKREPKKKLSKSIEDDKISHETLIDYDYYYYDSHHPYNLTIIKSNETRTKPHFIANTKEADLNSSEERDYEYDEEDLKFKEFHDSTTMPYGDGQATILSEADLVVHEKNFPISAFVDEKLKNDSSVT